MHNTIISYSDLAKYYPRKDNVKVVLVGGCFDIIHLGHIRFLHEAKKIGEYVLIALESDTFIRGRKKREPIHDQAQRAEILVALRDVDGVILLPDQMNNELYNGLVRVIKPAVIAVTQGDEQMENKKNQAKTVNGEVIIVTPFISPFSSSQILNYGTYRKH